MAKFKIINDGGNTVNTIEASPAFCSAYCLEAGYTYEAIEEPAQADPESTVEELTLDLLAEHEERLCMLELTTAE